MGTIHNRKLPGMDAEDGNMLYIKPTIAENVPRDVLAYRETHSVFPDQSTADQWFDESQFESYRRLGAYSFEFLTGTTGQVLKSGLSQCQNSLILSKGNWLLGLLRHSRGDGTFSIPLALHGVEPKPYRYRRPQLDAILPFLSWLDYGWLNDLQTLENL